MTKWHHDCLHLFEAKFNPYKGLVMKNTFTKFAASVLLASAAMTASASGLPFTIDTSVDPDTPANTLFPTIVSQFTADEINGNYVEGILVTSPTTFTASIVLNFTGFTGLSNQITGLALNYGMYAVIDVTGSITPNQFNTFDLGGFAGDISVYADWNNDSATVNPTFTAVAGVVSSAVANSVDDVLLGTAATLGGSTNVGAGSSSFALSSNTFMLTPAGEAVFVAPRPFYMELFSDGNLSDLFTEVDFSGAVSGLQQFDAQADIIFVPEPSTIAFLGLGLLGLGAASRRKS